LRVVAVLKAYFDHVQETLCRIEERVYTFAGAVFREAVILALVLDPVGDQFVEREVGVGKSRPLPEGSEFPVDEVLDPARGTSIENGLERSTIRIRGPDLIALVFVRYGLAVAGQFPEVSVQYLISTCYNVAESGEEKLERSEPLLTVDYVVGVHLSSEHRHLVGYDRTEEMWVHPSLSITVSCRDKYGLSPVSNVVPQWLPMFLAVPNVGPLIEWHHMTPLPLK